MDSGALGELTRSIEENGLLNLEDLTEAYLIIDRIEHTIVEYLHKVLVRVYTDWWTDGIPLRVRIAAADRAEEERNQLPKHSYLDLVQWKEVCEANWGHIESDWRRVGWSGNKKAGLK
jgi:hypothetical protein